MPVLDPGSLGNCPWCPDRLRMMLIMPFSRRLRTVSPDLYRNCYEGDVCALPLTRPLPSSSAPDALRWRGCPLCCCVCVYYGPSRAVARVVRRPCWRVDHPTLCEPPSLKLCVRELSSCRRRSTLRSTSHTAGRRACLGLYCIPFFLQVYLGKKPANCGPHFLVNESEARETAQCVRISSTRASQWR